MEIREAHEGDLQDLLELYTHLHDNPVPERDGGLDVLWAEILADKNHHILVAEEGGKLVSTCVAVVIRNLTRRQRPYMILENVVTLPECRGKGLATACLNEARRIAEKENAYKMMLQTGSKSEATLRFYERAGFNRQDKTAFIQWLNV